MRLLATALLVTFIASPATALTILHRVNNPAECPENLRVAVTPSGRDSDLLSVTVRFTPRSVKSIDVTTGANCQLRISSKTATSARVAVQFNRRQSDWTASFELHPSAFANSTLTVSSHLITRDGIGMVGGGTVYEIGLRGFLP